jgi:hypothetical protein
MRSPQTSRRGDRVSASSADDQAPIMNDGSFCWQLELLLGIAPKILAKMLMSADVGLSRRFGNSVNSDRRASAPNFASRLEAIDFSMIGFRQQVQQ